MTKDEAHYYFQDCESDLNDCYREKLFNYKQFFVLRPVISKLFLSKLEKLKSLENAYDILTDRRGEFTESIVTETPCFGEVILYTFNMYYAEKNRLKQAVFSATNGGELIQFVEALLQLEQSLSMHVTSYFNIDPEGVKLSVEHDPMDILKDIKELNESGVTSFADLDLDCHNNSLTEEIKRLHLWRQF